MKAKIYIDNGGFGAGYTEAFLFRICKAHGIEVVENADSADILLVSMCDPSDLPLLKQARSESKGQPVVMGGFEGYFGVPYLAWADAVNVGEGFEFFDALGSGRDWTALDCILKDDDGAAASYEIDWSLFPVVRTGKRKAYYMGGRGCHNKCKFCATSWVQPYRTNNLRALNKAISQAKMRRCKLTLICNDSRDMPRGKSVNAASITIRDYLRKHDTIKAGMLHFGVEGWTEQERRAYSKPISNENLIALINTTKAEKQRSELFMIAGRSGWNLDVARRFASLMPQDTYHLPTIHVKATYFDPCPHTPLAKEEPATEFVNIKKVFRVFNAQNKRFRVFPVRSLARSNWRTVLHRCTADQAARLGREPRDTNTAGSREEWLSKLPSDIRALAGKIDFDPCAKIKVRVK